MANLSGCDAKDSEAMVHCLREKTEAEILAINQVWIVVWFGDLDTSMWDCQSLLIEPVNLSPWLAVLLVLCAEITRQANFDV